MKNLYEIIEKEELVHGLIGLAPGGSLIDSILFKRIRKNNKEKLEKFISETQTSLIKINNEKLDITFLNSEEFDLIFLKTLEKLLYTGKKEKVELFKKFILNVVQVEYSINPLKETILEIISQISLGHLFVLQKIKAGEFKGPSGFNSSSSFYSQCKENIYSFDVIEGIEHDLLQKGLLEINNFEYSTRDISSLGKSLLLYLE